MKRKSFISFMVIFWLVIGLTLSSVAFAQDTTVYGFGFIIEQNNNPNNNQGNSDQAQTSQPVRQQQLVGYTVVVNGPTRSNGRTIFYGNETYTVRIRNRSDAIDEARSRFRRAYHLRPDTGLTIVSVDEIYE